LVTWVDEVLERIYLDPACKQEALLHVGQFKKLYEEIFPLQSLLRCKSPEWATAEFRNVLGDQSFDVEVKHLPLQFLEIACTTYDDGERWRMIELSRKGSVSALAKIVRDDRGRPTGLDIGTDEQLGTDMRCRDDVVTDLLPRIRERIMKKVAKPYPPGTGLLVFVDDAPSIIDENGSSRIAALLSELAPRWEPTFEHIFIVGSSGRLCIEQQTRALVH
jgi:hypothetical protein